jgi:hypothetical protein
MQFCRQMLMFFFASTFRVRVCMVRNCFGYTGRHKKGRHSYKWEGIRKYSLIEASGKSELEKRIILFFVTGG